MPLEKEQRDLLARMVEAERSVDASEREAFHIVETSQGFVVRHPGWMGGSVYPGDLRELAESGLLRLVQNGKGFEKYDVTGNGRRYYEWMKEQEGQPVDQVEAEVRHLLDGEAFQKQHPIAYARWAAAETELWGADSATALTDIGHACRESLVRFLTDLVEERQAENANPDPQGTMDRLRAVLKTVELSDAVEALLLAYFGYVWDLVQRQEHGAQKEGESLRWEDARRVVFHTAMVMFELDREVG